MINLLENQMEELIAQDPCYYLKEDGLKLISRQYRIGKYIFDLLFKDRHGAKVIVELQRGVLDRNHCYKIFDYLDEYRSQNPNEFIDVMIVANEITSERKKMLTAKSVKYLEIPEKEFIDRLKSLNLSTDNLIKANNNNLKTITSITTNYSKNKIGGPKSRIENNKYFIQFEDFKSIIKDYIIRGKRVEDKVARKKLLIDILNEYLNSTDVYSFGKDIYDLIKNKNYQKDFNNSFLRLIYYPILVSDETFNGKSLAASVFYDVAAPGNPKYPNFKILETRKYDFTKIKLRLNINNVTDYRKALEETIIFTNSVIAEID